MLMLIRLLNVILIIGIMISYPVDPQANESISPKQNTFQTFVKNFSNQIAVEENENTVTIKSNGIPNHRTGDFPRKGNPYAISEQMHILHFIKKPKKNTYITPSRFFGIALNGVMFIPQTAGCWNPQKQLTNLKTNNRLASLNGARLRTRTNGPCNWREEAIVGNSKRLGLDINNAHVQPNGMYHYHGFPTGLIKSQNTDDDLIHIGFAGDGFKIYGSVKNIFKSSYQLKHGERKGGPGGFYDGTYTQDFEFINGAGHLDECNGIDSHKHGYIYLITIEFPFIPRCWRGSPHPSFESRP